MPYSRDQCHIAERWVDFRVYGSPGSNSSRKSTQAQAGGEDGVLRSGQEPSCRRGHGDQWTVKTEAAKCSPAGYEVVSGSAHHAPLPSDVPGVPRGKEQKVEGII